MYAYIPRTRARVHASPSHLRRPSPPPPPLPSRHLFRGRGRRTRIGSSTAVPSPPSDDLQPAAHSVVSLPFLPFPRVLHLLLLLGFRSPFASPSLSPPPLSLSLSLSLSPCPRVPGRRYVCVTRRASDTYVRISRSVIHNASAPLGVSCCPHAENGGGGGEEGGRGGRRESRRHVSFRGDKT